MISKQNIILTLTILWTVLTEVISKIPTQCQGGKDHKYLWGDAMIDNPNCVGPNDMPYPTAAIDRALKSNQWGGSRRQGRSHSTIDPFITRKALLQAHEMTSLGDDAALYSRKGRASNPSFMNSCTGTPSRLCKTRYNTTAPMYGVSLTSGQPVTIVQKFPDLLQQVVFEVCESNECDVVRGECTQTYVPYLFLVIPLGPVTLTGQDYVLVESGCVCRPKYASQTTETPTLPVL